MLNINSKDITRNGVIIKARYIGKDYPIDRKPQQIKVYWDDYMDIVVILGSGRGYRYNNMKELSSSWSSN